MNAGQPMISLGNHPTLGPPWIEMSLPPTTLSLPETDAYLIQIHGDLQKILATLMALQEKLCRPPWWRRFWRKSKQLVAKGIYVAFSR